VRYLVEGTVNSAGSLIDWIRSLAGDGGASGRKLPDLDRIPLVVPSFSGLGAPHWASGARGAILDLDFRVGREELLAGALAGIGCRVREIVEVMEKEGLRARRIVAGGGLARSPNLLPLQAGILGRKILRSRGADGTARGAALLAGHASGAWDLGRDRLLRDPTDPIRPPLSRAAARRFYRRFREAVAQTARRGAPS
jgi:glycerol kinase